MGKIKQGTWVEIEQVVLQPAQRSTALPEDTKQVPYILRVSGFLEQDAEIGSQVTIKTIIGRRLSGELKIVNPSYAHTFGKVVPELLTIGTEYEA
ncbi:MAG: 2-amino-4-oxopentanoate thiolase subunit OrtA [Anaerolineaceae bacterium]|jgi:hypothetical protein